MGAPPPTKDLTRQDLPPVAGVVSDTARSLGVSAYLVGGSIRDLLLGRNLKDLDFVVFGPVETFAMAVADRLDRAKVIFLGRENKAVWRIVGREIELDFSPPRGPDLGSDLSERDFTINALAWSANDEKVVDEVGGVADLNLRLLRMTHDRVFRRDPIRMLRAFRLAAMLGFDIEPETLACIHRDRATIRNMPPERIRVELLDLLDLLAASEYVRMMDRVGILGELLMGAAETDQVSGPSHHTRADRNHAIAAVASVEKITRCIPDFFPGPCSGAVTDWLGHPRHASLLKLAILLSVPCNAGGESDQPAASIDRARENTLRAKRPIPAPLERLGLSKREAAVVVTLAAKHSLLFELLPEWRAGCLTQRAMLRFIRQAGEHVAGCILYGLAEADAVKTPIHHGGDPRELPALARAVMQIHVEIFVPRSRENRFVTGEDLKAMGLQPGPVYAGIIEDVEAARIEGTLHDREEALEWVRQTIERKARENG